MGLVHVTTRLRAFEEAVDVYESDFLVDTGATDCLAPASAVG